MRDCIDRRQGDALAFLCDDANKAWDRARDAAGWRRAHAAAMAVVAYYTDRGQHCKAHEWGSQAATCWDYAQRAERAEKRGGSPCRVSR